LAAGSSAKLTLAKNALAIIQVAKDHFIELLLFIIFSKTLSA
jgi:hypothetical protein